MDIINILPDSVANQIAAGEVVDRPAGAVKELVENAMDAGATQIDLALKDAGRTLIQVTDNGCGMSDSDARLCFERHATSKIHQADDLFAIHTMGFRGEALASIAAIAQVELRTRQMGQELGTRVVIEGSHIVEQHPEACPDGTTLSVKNLFFNVPARRNFLKKDSIEIAHIEEVFRRITLVHYDIGFSMTSNGKLMYDLKPGGMLQRIVGLFGTQYKERMLAVDEETDMVRIHGYVSRPECCKKKRGEQYLFVNGRFIKHAALSAAVERAYADLLPEKSYPSYFVSLQVDPSRIDINIHPTKTEVKFADENALFQILRSVVKRTIGQFALATEFSFDTPEEFNIGPVPKDFVPRQPRISYNENYNPFRPSGVQTQMKLATREERSAAIDMLRKNEKMVDVTRGEQRVEAVNTNANECISLQGRYIATALSTGFAIIDKQRALERIIYDRMVEGRRGETKAQTMLFPVSCQFTAADAELLDEMLPDLKQYGFEIAHNGATTFVVSAKPTDIKEDNLQEIFDKMIVDVKGATMQKYANRSDSLCVSMAKQIAAHDSHPLSQAEMQQIVADLFACPMAGTSPSGKKVITIINPTEALK